MLFLRRRSFSPFHTSACGGKLSRIAADICEARAAPVRRFITMHELSHHDGGGVATSCVKPCGLNVIGVLNIVLGSLTCVGLLISIGRGGVVAAIGSAAEHDMNGATGHAAMVGGALLLFALFGLLFGAGLLASGIGLLRLRPWGRSLSLAAATLGIVYTAGQAFILNSFGMTGVIGLAYPMAMILLLVTPAWKRAFLDLPETPEAQDDGSLRYRDAA